MPLSVPSLARCRRLLAAGVAVLGLAAGQPAAAVQRTSLGDYTLTQWDVDDGLPHNLPLAITQDARGRLWVATWEGVARFNGHQFRTYDRTNAEGAELAGGTSLLPGPDGSMLAGTVDGVHRYLNGQWSRVYPQLAGVRVEVMQRDRHGCLWVGSDNRLLRVAGQKPAEEYVLDANRGLVHAIVPMEDGRMLVGTDSGLYAVQEGRRKVGADMELAGSGPVLDVVPDGRAWLLGTAQGALAWDGQGAPRPLWSGGRVNRLVRGLDGSLWLNVQNGPLVVLDRAGGTTVLDPGGLRARALFRDRDGLVWGGNTQGLFHLSRGAAHAVAGSQGNVRAVLETADGSLWLGHGEGLRRLAPDGSTREVFDAHPDLRGASVMSLAPARDGGGLWVGTYDRGVLRIDLQGRLEQRIPIGEGLTSTLVRALLEGEDGTLWIGSGALGLLAWRDGVLEQAGDALGLAARLIQALYADPLGGIWVGTLNGAVHIPVRGAPRILQPDAPLPARSVFDFLRDPDGTLWMATDRGLVRLRDGQYTLFDSRRGLPRNKLFRVLDDGRYLWVSSNRGVFRLARQDLEAVGSGQRAQLPVAVVDHTDGMPATQGNGGSWPAGWRTADGRLLFPTTSGLGHIDGGRVAQRQVRAVPLELEKVLVDGEEADWSQGLHIAPDARRVMIHYTGLAYQAPERVRYRYRLVGFDPEWFDGGPIGQAVFTSLSPGNYRFEVESMTLPVDWNDRTRVGSQTLAITVAAPFWQHPLAVVLGIGTLMVLMYGLMWIRTTSYRRSQRQLNRIIDRRTDELIEKNFALEAAGRERDALMRQLAYQATHDALTGLPNRRAADERLIGAVHEAAAGGRPLAVGLVDLDHFKQVNDTRGHEAGDQVLHAVATRMGQSMPDGVFAARHGGEEFLVVIEGWEPERVRQWLEDLRRSLQEHPVSLADGTGVVCTISAGVAFFGTDGHQPRTLLATADARLYRAKRAGRNRVVLDGDGA